MRNFKKELSSIENIKDDFVRNSRRQSNEILVANLLFSIPIALVVELSAYYFLNLIVFPVPEIIILLYLFYDYSETKKDFIYEDRELFFSLFLNDSQKSLSVQSGKSANESIMLPKAGSNGAYILHVGLNQEQIRHIARTVDKKGDLPINYLQSLGLSRMEAEKLRTELAQHNLVKFDGDNKAIVTDAGKYAFNELLQG